MPSNRLSKVQKHIAKKKGKDAFGKLHENSRDTHRLQSAAQRDDKINRMEALRAKQNKPFCTSLLLSPQSHTQPTYHRRATPQDELD